MSTPLIKPAAASKTAAQLLEEQKARFNALAERRNRVAVELETAARQYAEAEAEAVREFGTGNLDELRQLYTTNEAENERRVRQFITEVDAVETTLSDIEKQLAS